VPPSGTPRRKIAFTISDLRVPLKNSSNKEKAIFLLGSALNLSGRAAGLCFRLGCGGRGVWGEFRLALALAAKI